MAWNYDDTPYPDASAVSRRLWLWAAGTLAGAGVFALGIVVGRLL
ncbi:MAG: hypothetical protein AB7I13_01795 [Vicinamibacterales bacterium]